MPACARLVQRTQGAFGTCILVDAHSMPSTGLDRDGLAKADIILGDRFGTSAAGYIIDIAEAAFTRLGLRVTRNRPYAGGFITEHYGAPASGVHAVQIEINRALYMNEATLEPHPGFGALEQAIASAMADCFARWSGWLDDWRAGGGIALAADRGSPGERRCRRNPEKRAAHLRGGPSLGRKRPRRANEGLR